MDRALHKIVREIGTRNRQVGVARFNSGYFLFLVTVILAAICCYFGYILTESLLLRVLFGAASFFLFSCLSISLGHQAFHRAVTGWFLLDRIIGVVTFIPLGVDGFLWQHRHITEHHPEPNREGFDEDIDSPTYFRLAPYTPYRWYHRYQHLYAPFLYSIGLIVTITIDDVRQLIRSFSRQRSKLKTSLVLRSLTLFILGKVLFVCIWILIPLNVNPQFTLGSAAVTLLVASVPVSWFFLPIGAAHLNMHTHFFRESEDADFFQQQSETTVDFSRDNTLVTWLYGGLNCHFAHHLWPRLPAHNYPQLTTDLERELQARSIISGEVVPHLSFFELFKSHFSLLRRLGKGDYCCKAI